MWNKNRCACSLILSPPSKSALLEMVLTLHFTFIKLRKKKEAGAIRKQTVIHFYNSHDRQTAVYY
jgi:hypothetical protein